MKASRAECRLDGTPSDSLFLLLFVPQTGPAAAHTVPQHLLQRLFNLTGLLVTRCCTHVHKTHNVALCCTPVLLAATPHAHYTERMQASCEPVPSGPANSPFDMHHHGHARTPAETHPPPKQANPKRRSEWPVGAAPSTHDDTGVPHRRPAHPATECSTTRCADCG